MKTTKELENMYCVKSCVCHGMSPIPQEGQYGEVKEVSQISGFSHGVGTCAMRQGACKLTLNVKGGVIREALVETVGCSGMTHSAQMAAEILPGKTVLEALNTDLVCDAINVAMREIFQMLAYGRTQSAFTDGGLAVGSGLEDLGAGIRSQVGTAYSSEEKGPRYLETTDGYVTKLGLDEERRIIGYQYIHLGRLMRMIAAGMPAAEALESATGKYGRFDEAAAYIDPREE